MWIHRKPTKIDLARYATGDGTDASPWLGWRPKIIAGDYTYFFRPGVFGAAAPLTFSIDRLTLKGAPGAKILYTGAITPSAVLNFSSPTGTTDTYSNGVCVDTLTIDGGTKAAGAVNVFATHDSVFRRIYCRGVTDHAYLSKWGVSNRLENLRYHVTFDGGTPPTNGIILDRLSDSVVSETTVNVLVNCWISGVPGIGLYMRDGIESQIQGGAFENNGTNAQVDTGYNNFVGVGFEGGPVIVNGDGNSFRNIFAASDITLNGKSNSVEHGFWARVTSNNYGNRAFNNQPFTTYDGTHPIFDLSTTPAGGYFATAAAGDLAIRSPHRILLGSTAQSGGAPTVSISDTGVDIAGNVKANNLPDPPEKAILLAAPVGYWRGGDFGTRLRDSSVHALHGTYSGAVAPGAAIFDGCRAAIYSGGVGTVPHNAIFNSTALSVVAVVQTAVTGTEGTICARDDEAGNRQFQFEITSGNQLRLILFAAGGLVVMPGGPDICDGAPHVVAVSYSDTGGALLAGDVAGGCVLWVDGVAVNASGTFGAMNAVTCPLEIGRHAGFTPFSGAIGEVATFNVGKSPNAIIALTNSIKAGF